MVQDLRYGIRMLLRHKGFTAVAALMLALGIGASTAIFSAIDATLLRPLPYAESERAVLVWGNFLKLNIRELPAKAAEYVDYRDRTQSFAQVAAFQTADMNLTGSGDPERFTVARVTANLFPMLGAQALHGRLISDDETEAGRDRVAVISHAFWRGRLGSAPDVIGHSLRLNETNYTIIGIMPESFSFPHPSFAFAPAADLWLPLVLDAGAVAERRGPYALNVLAHLKTGVTLAQAQAEMQELARQFERDLPGYRGPRNEDGGWRITLVPLQEQVVGASRRALWVLSGAVALVLLIACANVANLLLVRATARQKELAIRASLGAGRARIIRQLLVESLLLGGLGGALGAWLAWWSIKAIVLLSPAALPRAAEVKLDARVLAFTLLLSALTSALFGMVPALRASKIDLREALQGGGARGSGKERRARELLIVAEVALALPLLAGAGLLLNSFARVMSVEPGIAAERLLVAEISLPPAKYSEPARTAAFFDELAQRVAALPGVAAASFATRPVLSGAASSDPFTIESRPQDVNIAGWQRVGPDYFRALGIPLLAGRDFTDRDREGEPVAIVNESLARRYFPAGDALGQRILLGSPNPRNPNAFSTIVGIVKDIPHSTLESPPEPEFFLSFARQPHRTAYFYVRVAGEPEGYAREIRQTVLSIDREQPVKSVRTIENVIAATIAPRRFTTALLGAFALISLVLAALGVYSVNAYAVAQRTREIGIRMALGAEARNVRRMVLRRGLILIMAGLAIGIGAALAVTPWLESLLFDVSAADPATFGGVVLLLLLVAIAACYVPARRAAGVDPMRALRHD